MHKVTNHLGSVLWIENHELDKFQSPRLVLFPVSKLSDTTNQAQESATPHAPFISTQSGEKDENYPISLKDKVWQVNNEVEITHIGTKYIQCSTLSSACTDL